MNEMSAELRQKLPPTDSRLRPDQRALENGDLKFASSEKQRIEEKQRSMRKAREKAREKWKPRYFEEEADPATGEKSFRYVRDYWEDRRQGNWEHLHEIF